MYKRRGRNKSIAIRTGIGNMKECAALGHDSINGDYAPRETWQDVAVHPGAKDQALFRVAPFNEQNSYFQFQD